MTTQVNTWLGETDSLQFSYLEFVVVVHGEGRYSAKVRADGGDYIAVCCHHHRTEDEALQCAAKMARHAPGGQR